MFIFQVIDGAAGGTLARVLSYGGIGTISSNSGLSGTTSKRSSLTRTVTPNHLGLSSLTLSGVVDKDKDNSTQSGQAENLAQDMHDLMHDYDVVSRISGLIGSLKGQYEVCNPKDATITKLTLIHFQFRCFQGCISDMNFG